MTNLGCEDDWNEKGKRYSSYLEIANAIGNENPISYACFSALSEAQQNALINNEIAAGFEELNQVEGRVDQLPLVSHNGKMAYVSDGQGYEKQGVNNQTMAYYSEGGWYKASDNDPVVPNPLSIWDVGSLYNNYNPNLGAFNETILSSSVSGGIYTQNSLIDMPINGYLIRVYVKYQIKDSLRGLGTAPSFIFSNGWGASVGDFTNYANLDYAVVQYDWRGTFNGAYSYPATLMTLYPAALNRLNQVTNPNANYASQASVATIQDVRNQDMYYWYAIPRRVLAYTKSLTSDINISKIGFLGNSWGGQMAYNMNIEPDIKCCVAQYGNGWIHYWKTNSVWPYSIPYSEPAFTEGNNLYISTLESQAYAKYARNPMLWMMSTNDFHGQFDRGFRNFDLSPVKGSYAFKVNASHDISGFEQDVQLWFDKHLKGLPIVWPENPNTIPSIVLPGIAKVTVAPSTPADVTAIQIYYALITADPMGRTWFPATTTNNGDGTWSAQFPYSDGTKYVFAYAQITYSSTIIVCSKQAAFIPNNL